MAEPIAISNSYQINDLSTSDKWQKIINDLKATFQKNSESATAETITKAVLDLKQLKVNGMSIVSFDTEASGAIKSIKVFDQISKTYKSYDLKSFIEQVGKNRDVLKSLLDNPLIMHSLNEQLKSAGLSDVSTLGNSKETLESAIKKLTENWDTMEIWKRQMILEILTFVANTRSELIEKIIEDWKKQQIEDQKKFEEWLKKKEKTDNEKKIYEKKLQEIVNKIEMIKKSIGIQGLSADAKNTSALEALLANLEALKKQMENNLTKNIDNKQFLFNRFDEQRQEHIFAG
ncbi:MAG: hypothetical protein PHV30_00550 [Candidatus Margulisbacteria bacterium]|nr:hypothetical protein [Candidatus Margulisiibacteriota bacterium]